MNRKLKAQGQKKLQPAKPTRTKQETNIAESVKKAVHRDQNENKSEQFGSK